MKLQVAFWEGNVGTLHFPVIQHGTMLSSMDLLTLLVSLVTNTIPQGAGTCPSLVVAMVSILHTNEHCEYIEKPVGGGMYYIHFTPN